MLKYPIDGLASNYVKQNSPTSVRFQNMKTEIDDIFEMII